MTQQPTPEDMPEVLDDPQLDPVAATDTDDDVAGHLYTGALGDATHPKL